MLRLERKKTIGESGTGWSRLGALSASSVLTAAMLLGAWMPGVAANHPNGPNPVLQELNFVRSVNSSGPPATYDYLWTFEVWNHGDSDFTEDGWTVSYDAFNTDGEQSTPAGYLTVLGPYTTNIPTNNGILFIQHRYGETSAFCCGWAEFLAASHNQNSNENDDKETDNNARLAMLPAQTKSVRVAVFNFESVSWTFTHSIVDLPDSWSASLNRSTTTISAGDVAYVEMTVTAPTPVTSWPTVQVWSRNANHPYVDQVTTIKIRDDALWNDACGDS